MRLAFATIAGIVIIYLFCRLPRGQVYEGKSFEAWLQEYHESFSMTGNDQENNKRRKLSEEGIRQLGVKGLPTLLRMAGTHDSTLKTVLILFMRKYHLLASLRPKTAVEEHRVANAAFRILGPLAEPAVPDLIKQLDSPDDDIRVTAASSIGCVGPKARAAIPELIRLVSDTNYLMRINAAAALGNIHAEPQLAVPVLVAYLNDRSCYWPEAVIEALGKFGTNARSAGPFITPFLKQEKTKVRSAATNALDEIFPEGWSKSN